MHSGWNRVETRKPPGSAQATEEKIFAKIEKRMHNSGEAVVVSVGKCVWHGQDGTSEMPPSAWLGAIYERFRRELVVVAWAVLRRADLAEDAVHSAFAKLVQLRSPPVDPKLYVFRSVRNAAIDLAKAQSRRREEPLQTDWDAPVTAVESVDEELPRLVADSLQRLDDSSREVIELHLHAALTFEEIAQMLAEPLSTVASRYRRALEKLGKEIKVRHE
jgi:RNA polymerase sigma-70 factor (ECF subfamily)